MEQVRSKSGLVLIEMIIILLFLAIASALCVQVFSASHIKSARAEELSRACELAGGAAEIIRGSGQDENIDMMLFYPQGIQSEEGLLLFYDDQWNPCDQEISSYSMEIVITETEGKRQGNISIRNAKQEEIYALTAVAHIRYIADSPDGGNSR